ncbi:cytochrome P450 4C1, partial [Trichonephila inaurata madagascariensis]
MDFGININFHDYVALPEVTTEILSYLDPMMDEDTKKFWFAVGLLLHVSVLVFRPEAPPLCLALQGVTGVCRAVFKEKLCCIYVLFKPFILFYKPETVEVLLSSTTLIDKKTAMGVNIDAQGGRNTEYVRAVHEMGEAFMYRALRPWLYPNFIFKWTAYGRRFYDNLRRIQSLTKRVIKHKRQDMEERAEYAITEAFSNHSPSLRKKRKAFLELLLEHHLKDPSFTEEDVREEVHTFMFEGHDTTAMALSWALYCLGQNPEIQQRVQEELDDIFEDDIDRDIVREDLTRMKYLECVIK